LIIKQEIKSQIPITGAFSISYFRASYVARIALFSAICATLEGTAGVEGFGVSGFFISVFAGTLFTAWYLATMV